MPTMTMTYIPSFTVPGVINTWANIAKYLPLNKHKFSYSVDIYFKLSTEITYLSKDLLLSTLVGIASKWVWR